MKTALVVTLVLPGLLAACSSTRENLLFVETYDLGIGIHPAPTTGMIQFNVGFKATDLAVVPIASVEGDGHVNQRRAKSKNADNVGLEKDAVSVFAQFRNGTQPVSGAAGTHQVGIGRFFSTGVAAVNLARAYECAMQPAGTCSPCADCKSTAGTSKSTKSPKPDQAEPNSAAPSTQPTILKPLIFGQYDSYGLDIKPSVETAGGSLFDFSLGYSGKNFAVMPLFALEHGSRYKELGGEGGQFDDEAYSVLGQFKADSATTSPNLKLERFFATGLAAQYLSRGLQARIAEDLRKAAAATAE